MPLNALIWGWAFLIFISFPHYSKWLNPKKKRAKFSKYTVIFDFGLILMLLWAVFMVSMSVYLNMITEGVVLHWGFISLIILFLISIDLLGSTPIFKSGLHEERVLNVVLDENKCKGAGFCEQVCPVNCFEMDRVLHIVTMPRAERCVQCGACIVQCPFDALFFKSPNGKTIPPENIREYKLNLLGKRFVKENKVKTTYLCGFHHTSAPMGTFICNICITQANSKKFEKDDSMIAKKPMKEIKTESAKLTITTQHEKFGKTISVNGCFGSSDIGQMTGFIAREIVKRIPNAFMRCPLALYPEVEGPIQVLLHDDFNVVIDGCKDRCLKRTFETAGLKVDLSYALDKDFGLSKNKGPDFDEEKMRDITEKIIRDIEEKMLGK